jgi:hypothetical protein
MEAVPSAPRSRVHLTVVRGQLMGCIPYDAPSVTNKTQQMQQVHAPCPDSTTSKMNAVAR